MRNLERQLGSFGLKVLKAFVLEKNLEPSQIDHSKIKSILVILRHQMGDMVAATPMLRSLKQFYTDARLTLVTKSSTNYEKIFTGVNEIADDVLKYEYGFENFVNLVKELRTQKPDLAVVPSTVSFSATNHLIAYYSNAPLRAGANSMDYEDNPSSYLLNIKNDFLWSTKKVHQRERNLDIIRQLGITPAFNTVKITIDSAMKDFARSYFSENRIDRDKKIMVFHTGAGKKENIWPPERFAELASKIAVRNSNQSGIHVVISEGPDDKPYVQKLCEILSAEYPLVKYTRYAGPVINTLAIIDFSDLFVSNDTGIMHLVSGLDTPMAAIFGPTSALEWGPVGSGKVSIQSPSSKIESITAEVVANECKKLLETPFFAKKV